MIRWSDTRNTAPIDYRRCPCHGQLVAVDGDGRLLGQCSGCATDAAIALKRLARMVRRAS